MLESADARAIPPACRITHEGACAVLEPSCRDAIVRQVQIPQRIVGSLIGFLLVVLVAAVVLVEQSAPEGQPDLKKGACHEIWRL